MRTFPHTLVTDLHDCGGRERRRNNVLRNYSPAILFLATLLSSLPAAAANDDDRDARLWRLLQRAGFSGRIESTLKARLGRQLNRSSLGSAAISFSIRSRGCTTTTTVQGRATSDGPPWSSILHSFPS
jgi:hypothetical protein